MNKKVDLRYNDVKEAVIEMSRAMKSCQLTDNAVAVLIADGSKVTKTQALLVIKRLKELETLYIKKGV